MALSIKHPDADRLARELAENHEEVTEWEWMLTSRPFTSK